MFEVFFPIIVIVLGILAASHLFSKSKPEKGQIAISGYLIANLVVIIPALFIGLISNAINTFFVILPLVGLGFIIALILWRILNKKRINVGVGFSKSLRIGFLELPSYFIVLCVVIVCVVIITIFHPLASEWDAVSVYLQNARSIQLTGTLSYDVLRDSVISSLKSPALSITYAWLMDSSTYWVRLWPFLNIVFLAYPVHKLVLFFQNGKPASKYSLSLLAILLSPIVLIMLGKFSLYEDIPFMLWFFTSIMFGLDYRREGSRKYLILSVLSIVLAYFSKDITIFLLPSLIAILLWSNSKLLRLLLSIFSVSPFLLISLNDAITLGPSVYVQSGIRLGLTIALAIAVFLASTKLSFKPTSERFVSKILMVIIASMPIWLFSGYLWISRGLLSTSWGYSISTAINTINTLNGLAGAVPEPKTSWNFLYGWFTILTDLLPIILLSTIGVYALLKQKKREFFAPLVIFLNLFLLFTFLFGTSDARRAFYFLPLSISLAIFGIDCLFDKISKHRRQLVMVLFLCSSFFYWSYSYGGISNILFFVTLPDSLHDALFFIALTSLVGVLGFFLRKKFSNKSFPNGSALKKTRAIIVVFLLLIAPLVTVYVFRPIIAGTSANGFSPTYYNGIESWNREYTTRGINTIWAGGNISEVIDYFRYVQDTHAIVSFYSYFLSFYLNRSEIDMCSVWGVQTLLANKILTANNSQELHEAISRTNIRYFLLPTADNPFAWGYYQKAREMFFLFQDVEKDPMFMPLRTFSAYVLYVFGNQSGYMSNGYDLLTKLWQPNSQNVHIDMDNRRLIVHADNATAQSFIVAAVSIATEVRSIRASLLLNYELLEGDANTTRLVLEFWAETQNGTLTFILSKSASFTELSTVFESSVPTDAVSIQFRIVMVPSVSQSLILSVYKAYVFYG